MPRPTEPANGAAMELATMENKLKALALAAFGFATIGLASCSDIEATLPENVDNAPILNVDGIVNTKCNNCGANTEFMAPSLPLPTGNYACAFSYIWGPETIYCSTTNDSHDEIVKTDTLVLDGKYTKELNVRTIGDSETIGWCRGGTVKVNGNAYIQLLLPDNTRASQAKVEVICGDKAKLPSTWTTKFATHENLVCNNCGANVEYMTDKISPTSGEVCASIVTFGTKTYACPIAGGAPAEFNASTELNDAFLSTVSE